LGARQDTHLGGAEATTLGEKHIGLWGAQELQQAVPMLKAAGRLCAKELRKVMRRLHKPEDKRSKKDSVRPFARSIGKLSHANPFAAADVFTATVCFSALAGPSSSNGIDNLTYRPDLLNVINDVIDVRMPLTT
jgi:hypothetical protein